MLTLQNCDGNILHLLKLVTGRDKNAVRSRELWVIRSVNISRKTRGLGSLYDCRGLVNFNNSPE